MSSAPQDSKNTNSQKEDKKNSTDKPSNGKPSNDKKSSDKNSQHQKNDSKQSSPQKSGSSSTKETVIETKPGYTVSVVENVLDALTITPEEELAMFEKNSKGVTEVAIENPEPKKVPVSEIKSAIETAAVIGASDIKQGKSVNNITKKIFTAIAGIVGSVCAIGIIYIIQQYAVAYFTGDTSVFKPAYISSLLDKTGISNILTKQNIANMIKFIKNIMLKYFTMAKNLTVTGVSKAKDLTINGVSKARTLLNK